MASCFRKVPLTHWQGISNTDFDFSDMVKAQRRVFTKNDGNYRVRIRLSQKSILAAKKKIEEKIFILKALFQPTRPPYPGAIKQLISCAAEYSPRFHELSSEKSYSMLGLVFANSRGVHGSCNKADQFYRSAIYFLYCKQGKKLFEIQLQYKMPISDKKISLRARKFKCAL